MIYIDNIVFDVSLYIFYIGDFMEIKQIKYFHEIANTGSINETAKRLNMSQPPLTYQIHQLEEELQIQLFERSQKGVTLTKAGQLFYERCQNILNYLESTQQEMKQFGQKEILRIGITHTTLPILMPYFKQFSKLHKDVHYEIQDAITYTLLNYLFDGIVDIAIVRSPVRLDGLNSIRIQSDTMIAISNKKNKDTLTLSDLKDTPLMIYRRYEDLILKAFQAQNITPDIFCLCDDARDQLLWAKEGLCTAIFPKSMMDYCEGLNVQDIHDENLSTDIYLVWPKQKKVSNLVQDYIDLFSVTPSPVFG